MQTTDHTGRNEGLNQMMDYRTERVRASPKSHRPPKPIPTRVIQPRSESHPCHFQLMKLSKPTTL